MRLKKKLGWTSLVAITSVVLAALTVRGRDDDTRFKGFITCDELQQDPSTPRWTPKNCIDGHECVYCELGDTGDKVGPDGQHNVSTPANLACGGDRLIGICAFGQDGLYCDTSGYSPDGICSGYVSEYLPQAIAP